MDANKIYSVITLFFSLILYIWFRLAYEYVDRKWKRKR